MRRALCIGINDYAGTGSDLAGCVNDAYDWAEFLVAHDYDVNLLLDAQASRVGLLTALESMIDARPGDSLVVTYSGHGTFVPDRDGDEQDGYDEAWCPADIGSEVEPITDDDLFAVFARRAPGVHLAVISDSCHSGTVSRLFVDSEVEQTRVRFMPPGDVGTDVLNVIAPGEVRARPGGRTAEVLLAGCRDDQYAYDAWFGGRANGAFTKTALAVYGQGVTWRRWHRLIRLRLPSWRFPQTPQLRGVRSVTERPAFSTIVG